MQPVSSLRSSRSTSDVRPFLAAWITLAALSSDLSAIAHSIARADYPAHIGQMVTPPKLRALAI